MTRKHIIYLLTAGIFISALVYIFIQPQFKEKATFAAHNGSLNLSAWKLNEDPRLDLKGQWLFYPNKLSSDLNEDSLALPTNVPHFWEDDSARNYSPNGYGTYTLNISGLNPNVIYGIEMIDTVTAYHLYINDELLISNGIVGKTKDTSTPTWKEQIGVFKAKKDGTVSIRMEVSNFSYYRGGFWNCPQIGLSDTIITHAEGEKVKEMLLFALIMSCSLFSLSLFMVYRKDKTTLFFSLACAATAVQTLLIGQRVVWFFLPAYNWEVMVRIEYLSGYLMLPLFVLFFTNLIFPPEKLTIVKRILYGFMLITTVTVIVPGNFYSSYLSLYKWASLLISLYFALIIIVAIFKKRGDYELMLFAMVIMVIALIKENTIGGIISWIPYASLVFIFCFAHITLKHFLVIIKTKEDLEEQIVLDPLTGLYNRNFVKELDLSTLSTIHDHKKYFLFLDLDDFKYVNDTYGHKAGDFTLRKIGHRFRSVLNQGDIICRYGGDEFFAIVFAENDDQILSIAKKIIDEVQQPLERDGKTYQVGISIGICQEQPDIFDLDYYLKCSDKAMYAAKKSGKNRFVLYESD